MIECGDHIPVFSSHSLRMKRAPIMATNLSQPVLPVITGLLIAVNSTLTQAEVIPKILHRQSKVGVRYIVKPLSDGEMYLKIQGVDPGSPAKRSGLQSGDWISRVGNVRVKSRDSFDEAIASAQDRTSFRVWDQNSRRWTSIDIVLSSAGQPAPPNPNADQNLDLIETWQSSLGGTIRFRHHRGQMRGEAHTPLAGTSDLFLIANGDGSYNFTYQQRGGFRDSGHGRITPRDCRTMDAYLVNRLGMRVEFTLTRLH